MKIGSLFANNNSIINSIVHNSKNNMVTSNKQSSFHNVNNNMELDLSLKFNFELEQSGDTNHSDSEDEVFYDSYETKEEIENNQIAESVDGSFINLKIEDNYFDNSFQIKKDIRKNRHLRDFEYVSSSIPIDVEGK